MNLFLNPSVNELHNLIQNAPEGAKIHDVVIDYDGEVLINPQLEHPDLDLNKFKFRIQLTEFSKRALMKGSNSLKYLLTSLVNAWNSKSENTGIAFT
ncbi:MAG: hypothetical protein ABI763_03790 [Bacteroidota bacterium]